jgi:hypothetical protein
MAGQSGSARFEALFESALQNYQKTTGVALAQHPLAIDLQSCKSADDITTLLQDQIQAFSKFRESDRMMKAIRTTVSMLTPLSDAASLANTVGLVRQKAPIACSTSLTFFQTSLFPPAKAIQAGLGILLEVCTALRL